MLADDDGDGDGEEGNDSEIELAPLPAAPKKGKNVAGKPAKILAVESDEDDDDDVAANDSTLMESAAAAHCRAAMEERLRDGHDEEAVEPFASSSPRRRKRLSNRTNSPGMGSDGASDSSEEWPTLNVRKSLKGEVGFAGVTLCPLGFTVHMWGLD